MNHGADTNPFLYLFPQTLPSMIVIGKHKEAGSFTETLK